MQARTHVSRPDTIDLAWLRREARAAIAATPLAILIDALRANGARAANRRAASALAA